MRSKNLDEGAARPESLNGCFVPRAKGESAAGRRLKGGEFHFCRFFRTNVVFEIIFIKENKSKFYFKNLGER